jgi:hypothetical protein
LFKEFGDPDEFLAAVDVNIPKAFSNPLMVAVL